MHITPPRSTSPPQCANPHTRLLHRAQGALHRRDTLIVRTSANLSEESLEVVRLEPRGGILEALSTNRR